MGKMVVKTISMTMIADFVHLLFLVYTTMIFARILGSWFPNWQHTKIMRFVAFYTEPYLGLFRKVIPPIGGMLDLSPMFAFLALRFMEGLILRFIH